MKSSKLLANNWVITLTATLIGVFLALYLNEWVASNNLSKQKKIATKNILAEILSNQKNLKTSILEHTKLLDFWEFSGKYVDEEENLIAPADSMHKFRNKYPKLVIIKDSTLLKNGNYKYKGEMNFELSIPHLQFTTIAWKTLQNSGFSATYGFECLMYLETIDKLINEITQKDEELIEYLRGLKDSGIKDKNLIDHLKLQIIYEKSLSEYYQQSEKELKNCD